MPNEYLLSLPEALFILADDEASRDFMLFTMAIVAIKKFPLDELLPEQQAHIPALTHLQNLLTGKKPWKSTPRPKTRFASKRHNSVQLSHCQFGNVLSWDR